MPRVDLDTVILGGGAAGLWLLDVLVRAGHRVLLLEAAALGRGQTIASQGIVHGGLKYALNGAGRASAKALRDMPGRWRRCLAGEALPDLSATQRRSEYCCLWTTGGLRSRLGLAGARLGLAIQPVPMSLEERPVALRGCAGTVLRLDEQVIEPASFLSALADVHRRDLLRIDADGGLEFDCEGPGEVRRVRLLHPDTGDPVDLHPRQVVLTAGAGNAALLALAGLDPGTMQRRPLRMVMARGELPPLHGHCIDGGRVRLTITATADCADRTVWQIGGGVAEAGADLDDAETIALTREELAAVLPGIDFDAASFATQAIDRAEAARAGGGRPGDAEVLRQGTTITAWPTKLALVPRLVDRLLEVLEPPGDDPPRDDEPLVGWPRPVVDLPPWERDLAWI